MNDWSDKTLKIAKWACVILGGIIVFVGEKVFQGVLDNRNIIRTTSDKIDSLIKGRK